MKLKVFNTLTKKKEDFIPLSKEKVWIYSCWPTVYSKPHIWNMKAYIFANLLRNVIENILWYKVTHVVNITDVWHLTDDWDSWEDKLEKASKKENKTAREIAREYEKIFFMYLKKLNLSFDIFPRATDHIHEQIEMVKTLEKKWYTYKIDWDWIYMDTSKVKDYWKLLNKWHLDWILACARVKNDKKKNKTDFALWKFSPKDKQRQMERESPRWLWFPWWHIECSAMSSKYLWERFDIHTWWIDHIPVHHTNEIAQSECYFWHDWVHYWIHNQFLNLKEWKMSKSLWNVITIEDIEKKWIEPLVFKYFIYLASYRSIQDFSYEDLKSAEKSFKKLKKNLNTLKTSFGLTKINLNDIKNIYEEKKIWWQLIDYLLDDLDTVRLIADINKYLKNIKNFKKDEIINILSLIKYIDDKIFKLNLFYEKNIEIPKNIQELAKQRWKAKENKDFKTADKIREQLLNLWYKILDNKDWYKIILKD